MHSSLRRAAFGVLSSLVIAAGVFAQQRPQVPGAIRSKVVLVPVDVRVIDRDGNPVTDLTQADFTVLEDGRLQQIGHFSTQAFEAAASEPAQAGPSLRRGPGLEEAPVTHRTFLIVLGRGRLQHPSKGMSAAIDFVRARMLPQDRVAVMAYGRTTDLMADRASVTRFLEHYEREHPRLEALLDHWFRGPWTADQQASPGIEARIAALFDAPGLPPARRVPVLDVDGEGPFERRQRESLEARRWPPRREEERDFVYDAAGRQDLEKLHAAIEFLRYFEGEKHVLYLSEQGLVGAGPEQSDLLAGKAADARVAISTIQTGGVSTSWGSVRDPGSGITIPAIRGPSLVQRFAITDMRAIARRTGGLSSAYKYASQALDRLDRATRFQYLLGYYPANTDWDGEPRRIEVRVNRPGLTVLHRHSYFAREDLVPFDRRAFLTHSRITGASAYRVLMRDVAVTVTGAVFRERNNQWQARAEVSIDPSTLAFEQIDGRHVAEIDVAVFVGARNQRQVGEVRRRVELKLEPESYARMQKEGVKFETMIELTGQPRYLKAVVYDYAADRLGSAVAEIK